MGFKNLPKIQIMKKKSEQRTEPHQAKESKARMKQPGMPGQRKPKYQPKGLPGRGASRSTPKSQSKNPPKSPPKNPMERLQKIIARAGITSRRKAEELITQGRVTVNRKVVVELGAKADPEKDVIEVDGKNISPSVKGPKAYILLNKPKGFISSVSDPLKRPVVTDLIKRSGARVYPVGRLDYDAEGVLILTNDGELANRLIHPAFDVPKKYLVKVKDVPTREELERLERGVYLEDGRTRPARARLIRETKENSWIELTVYEGRNRLVKRMCQAVGHPVSKLKRVEFAGIKLHGLKPGEYRALTEKELETLRRW